MRSAHKLRDVFTGSFCKEKEQSVFALVLSLMTVTLLATARPSAATCKEGLPKVWSTPSALTITTPVDPKARIICLNTSTTVAVAASDSDHFIQKCKDDNTKIFKEGDDPDTLTYSWAGGGTFTTPTQASSGWKSDTPGEFDLVCTIDDLPKAIDTVGGESGSRDDTPAQTFTVKVVVVKVEMVNPAKDPTLATEAAEGTNEFTFNSAAQGVCTIQCTASITPNTAATRTWALSNVSWSTTAKATTKTWKNEAGQAVSKGLSVACKLTGLPSANTDFGKKDVTMTACGTPTTRPIEVFYTGTATNHTGGDATHPNWFHYYRQNHGGTYAYNGAARSQSQSGVAASIRIGDEAYAGDTYITTSMVAGRLTKTGWSTTNRYYANFVGVVAHETQHTTETTAGPPTDNDGDFLSAATEAAIGTDPNDKYSSGGTGAFDDGEVYAGGPVEQAGIAGADTSQDWASPGTNKQG